MQNPTKDDIVKAVAETGIQEPLGMQDTDDGIAVPIIDRNPGKVLAENCLHIPQKIIINVNHKGIGSRHHDLPRQHFIQRKDSLQHLDFFRI